MLSLICISFRQFSERSVEVCSKLGCLISRSSSCSCVLLISFNNKLLCCDQLFHSAADGGLPMCCLQNKHNTHRHEGLFCKNKLETKRVFLCFVLRQAAELAEHTSRITQLEEAKRRKEEEADTWQLRVRALTAVCRILIHAHSKVGGCTVCRNYKNWN